MNTEHYMANMTLGLEAYADRCARGFHLTSQHPTLCVCTTDTPPAGSERPPCPPAGGATT